MASAWIAELKPMSRLSTPWASRRSDSSGQIRPVISPTIEMQPVAAATPRQRSAAVNAISATSDAPCESAESSSRGPGARSGLCAAKMLRVKHRAEGDAIQKRGNHADAPAKQPHVPRHYL